MGKRVILNLMFLLLLNITSINAQENLKEHTISRTQTAPKIDGILDDPCWDHYLSINSFKQQFPNFNAEPSQKSEIKITYDNYSIYMKLVMHILRFQFQFNLMFLGWNHVINSIKPRQYELKREK